MSSNNAKIILASQSPRRRELLKELALNFEVEPCPLEETLRPDQTPEQNALTVARAKTLWVARRRPGYFVLGADTIVVLDGKIIGKPEDESDARRILETLGGRRHQVITGVAALNPKGALFEEAAVSTVNFKPLTGEEIAAYVSTGEPLDKAGAYAIQGKGAFMVESYQGSYSNIVGLPLDTTEKLLRRAGYKI